MKVIELLRIFREPLKMMSESDVMRDDWQYVDMFEQYVTMRKCRVKYREVIRVLSYEYKVSKSTVERIIRRLSKDC